MQFELPFNISPGCQPYYSKYIQEQRKICKGDLVFKLGEKPSCRECAALCSGCIEMAINFGYSDFDSLKHLISKPENLSPKYQVKWKIYTKKIASQPSQENK